MFPPYSCLVELGLPSISNFTDLQTGLSSSESPTVRTVLTFVQWALHPENWRAAGSHRQQRQQRRRKRLTPEVEGSERGRGCCHSLKLSANCRTLWRGRTLTECVLQPTWKRSPGKKRTQREECLHTPQTQLILPEHIFFIHKFYTSVKLNHFFPACVFLFLSYPGVQTHKLKFSPKHDECLLMQNSDCRLW